MTVLASSDVCPNHIWRHRHYRAWGIQGHPELTVNEAPVWFEENRAVLEKDGADVDALKRSARQLAAGTDMVRNFALLCLGHGKASAAAAASRAMRGAG
jgi:GMP synthase-like glutamine amidotransferase